MSSHHQPNTDPLVGTLLDGKYRVVRLIGVGGMGAVYEGRHEAINRRVAIKVLLPQIARDPKVKQRFINEARIGGELGQENIVEVTDLGDLPTGAPYLVMEYLDGGNLAQFVRERGPLPIDVAAEVIGRVLEALVAVHQRGVVHRDLKPANIFLAQYSSPTGRKKVVVKVLDFGISKLHDSDDPELTQDGARLGSPAFMSPEQARNTKYADHRSDIYSVGAVFYTALTGLAPFQAGSTNEVLLAVMTEEVTPPSCHRPDLPVSVEQVVLKAMARAPEMRFQSAQEFLSALEPFFSGHSTLADGFDSATIPDSVARPSYTYSQSSLSGAVIPPTDAGRPARWPWAVLGVLALLLILGMGVFWQLAQSRGVPTSAGPSPPTAAVQPVMESSPPTAPATPEVDPSRLAETSPPTDLIPTQPVAGPGPSAMELEAAVPVAASAPGPSEPDIGLPTKRPPPDRERNRAPSSTEVETERTAEETNDAPASAPEVATDEPDPAPAFDAAAVRTQVRRRLGAVQGAVGTCMGNRAARVRCTINLNGRTGEARSVNVTTDPPSPRASRCVRAVVGGVSFPRFNGESLRVSHTFRISGE